MVSLNMWELCSANEILNILVKHIKQIAGMQKDRYNSEPTFVTSDVYVEN